MKMASPNLDNDSVDEEDSSPLFHKFQKKPYHKIELLRKLNIIHALDNGQSKVDIAREQGVHPQTIAYIYKQKECIIRKYTQKFNLLKEVRFVNLDQALLDWFNHEISLGNVLKEEKLRDKAGELIKSLNEKLNCLDEWLLDFRLRHKIMKYTPDVECSEKCINTWKEFINDFEAKDFYIGGMCSLLHSIDLDTYAHGQYDNDDYVSVFFVVNKSGLDKKELVVAGKERFSTDIKSLPLYYSYSSDHQLSYSIVKTYLEKWNVDLITEERNIVLALDLPENILEKFYCSNIKFMTLFKSPNNEYFAKVINRIVGSFKYHYRKIQITQKRNLDSEYKPFNLIDCIHTMSLAWHNISSKYIQHVVSPPEEDSLYFTVTDESDKSLYQWCALNNIHENMDRNVVDKFVECDKSLPFINLSSLEDDKLNTVEGSEFNTESRSPSGIEAYRALKRLVCYLQGESVEASLTNSAKYLEDHLEYNALLEMHQIISNADETE